MCVCVWWKGVGELVNGDTVIDVRVCGRIPVGQPLSLHEPGGNSPGIVAEPVKSGHRGHAALRSATAASPPL